MRQTLRTTAAALVLAVAPFVLLSACTATTTGAAAPAATPAPAPAGFSTFTDTSNNVSLVYPSTWTQQTSGAAHSFVAPTSDPASAGSNFTYGTTGAAGVTDPVAVLSAVKPTLQSQYSNFTVVKDVAATTIGNGQSAASMTWTATVAGTTVEAQTVVAIRNNSAITITFIAPQAAYTNLNANVFTQVQASLRYTQ